MAVRKKSPARQASVKTVFHHTGKSTSKKMMELKAIDIMSLAKIQALIGAVFGLIIGFVYFFILLFAGILGNEMSIAFLGIGALILAPVGYGVAGFLGGALGALVYNFAATKVGGLLFTFKE